MDFFEYFQPINIDDEQFRFDYKSYHLAKHIHYYSEQQQNLSDVAIAIIGVEEERNSHNNKGCSEGPNFVRKFLYRLAYTSDKKIADFGNLKVGASVDDTYFALSNIIEELIKQNIIPIIIGGSQDLTYSNFLAYKNLEQTVNIVAIDAKLNLDEANHSISSDNYLTKIILHQPNYLFNFSNIGYQTYFVAKEEIELISKLYFDAYRLGEMQKNMEEVEPVIRDADMVSFDVSAIRQSEAPGNNNASPNGFYGEEACQIARYAGISDKLTSIGFYEFNPSFDNNHQTAHAVAQMIWYFIDGVANRKNDFPIGSRKNYTKYVVSNLEEENELVFYKSDKSDRWWIVVPYPTHEKIKNDRHLLVPCSYKDYQTACNNELPDVWIKTFQKLV